MSKSGESATFVPGMIFLVVSVVAIVALSAVRIAWDISFSLDCNQYLKRASDANTVELAKSNISQAIRYLEKHDLTNGVVSIFFRQPGNDIGFWYVNLKSSLEELNKVNEQTTQLERTNLLMKLRETLLDQGKEGESVTCPEGISVYPHNKAFFWLFMIWLAAGCLGGIMVMVDAD